MLLVIAKLTLQAFTSALYEHINFPSTRNQSTGYKMKVLVLVELENLASIPK